MRLVAGEGQVQARQLAAGQPALQFVAAIEVMGRVALAEQQPVAPVTGGDPRLEQAAQAGQAAAIADQDQRALILGRMEGAVTAYPRQQVAVQRRVLGQPAGAEAEAAVGMPLLAHDQFQYAIAGQGGDRVFARRQWHQRIQHGLGVQAEQVGEAVRQLPGRQRLAQRLRHPGETDRLAAVDAMGLQPASDPGLGLARQHLEDIAGQPVGGRFAAQPDQIGGRALAAGVEQLAPVQRPQAIRLRGAAERLGAGQLTELELPVGQRQRIAGIHPHRLEQRARALLPEPAVQALGKTAELRVLPIAEGEHGVAQVRQRQRLAEQVALEAAGAVRRLTVAEGTDHEQGMLRLAQHLPVKARQRLDPHAMARRLQLPGSLPGQLLGETALAGEADQPGARPRTHRQQRLAGGQGRTLVAPPIQVQQPAGNGEQRHAQAGQQHQDAPAQAEVAADMQGIDAGQQLIAERLLAIAPVATRRAALRVQRHLVEGAIMGGVGEQVEHRGRLTGRSRQAQTIGAKLRPGGLLQPGPERRMVHRRQRLARKLSAPAAMLAWFSGRLAAEQTGQAFAVPVVGPVQPGQRRTQIERQAPGAGHRMQIPIERATTLGPVQAQPGAPARGLPRPTQIQAGEAEEDQRQGAGGGDLLAVLAHGEKAVQFQHQLEKALPARRAEQLAAIGVEIAQCSTALTRRRGEHHSPGRIGGRLHIQAHHPLQADRLDARQQHIRRQYAAAPHLDPQHLGIERTQQFVLERIGRAGHAHQGQDQAGSDAEQPMQLKEDFLQHFFNPTGWSVSDHPQTGCTPSLIRS